MINGASCHFKSDIFLRATKTRYKTIGKASARLTKTVVVALSVVAVTVRPVTVVVVALALTVAVSSVPVMSVTVVTVAYIDTICTPMDTAAVVSEEAVSVVQ